MVIHVQRFIWCGFVTIFGCYALAFSIGIALLPAECQITYFQLTISSISWYMVIPALVLQSFFIVSDFTPGPLFAPYFLGKTHGPYGFHEPAHIPYRLNLVLCPLRDSLPIFGFVTFAASLGATVFAENGSVSKAVLSGTTGLGLLVTLFICALIIRRNRNQVREAAMKNKETNPQYYEECLKLLCLEGKAGVSEPPSFQSRS